MDFTTIFVVLTIFVGAPWALFTGIAKVKGASAASGSGKGSTLRKSELTALVEEAVAEATAPLRTRIETLEAIATEDEHATRRLDAALLADLEGPESAREDDAPAVVRRRTRG